MKQLLTNFAIFYFSLSLCVFISALFIILKQNKLTFKNILKALRCSLSMGILWIVMLIDDVLCISIKQDYTDYEKKYKNKNNNPIIEDIKSDDNLKDFKI